MTDMRETQLPDEKNGRPAGEIGETGNPNGSATVEKQVEKETHWLNVLNYVGGLISGILLSSIAPIQNATPPLYPSVLVILLIAGICYYYNQKYFAVGLATVPLLFNLFFFHGIPFKP